MTDATQRDLVSRDAVLKLLTDEETARVSTAETKSALVDGADYVDLGHLGKGVQRAEAVAPIPMGDVIPRSAVSAQTWTKIVTHLAR